MEAIKLQREAKGIRISVKDLEIGQCLRVDNKTVRIDNRWGNVFSLTMLQQDITFDGYREVNRKVKLDPNSFYTVIEGVTDLFTATNTKIV